MSLLHFCAVPDGTWIKRWIFRRAPAPNAERAFLKSGCSDDSVKCVQETRSLGLFKHLLLSSEKIHYLYFGSNG